MGISIWSILVVILMLGLLVTIHELGHFWAACLLKIKSYEVSIFVGPKLFSWKRNGVEYSIRALPFGAYVRFTEIDDEGRVVSSDDPSLLINQKRWKRLLVSLAGPFMNALLGIIIFSVLFCATNYTSLNVGPTFEGTQLAVAVENGAQVTVGDTITHINGHRVWTYLDFYYEVSNGTRDSEPMVVTFVSTETHQSYEVTLTPELTTRPMIGITHPDTTDNKYNGWEIIEVNPMQNNGNPILKVGDYLIAIDDFPVADEGFEDYFSSLTEDTTMKLTYVRNGQTFEEECIKTMLTFSNDRGLRIITYKVDSAKTFFSAIGTAIKMPITITNVSIRAIGDVFEGEEEVYNMVSGPVGVTSVVSDVVDDVDDDISTKVFMIFELAAIISIGLMFTNLLPIPGLDGMQIILLFVEMIIGHPLSEKTENVITIVGFILLVLLMIFAFASDIIRIIVGG